MRCEWIERRQNCIALGPSGTGKTHTALGLGLAACQKGYSVAFTTAAALVHELMEARDERRLRALQKHLNTVKLLIVDELGYVPFTAGCSELLFEVFSQRYERGATLVTGLLAETKCAKGRRESVPVGLREKGCEARFIFVLPCRFIFWWRGLLRFAFSGFGFAPEPIAAVPSCWWRADSFRRSSPGCGHDG